jgi:hypothetical protein
MRKTAEETLQNVLKRAKKIFWRLLPAPLWKLQTLFGTMFQSVKSVFSIVPNFALTVLTKL